jgi:diguanylate cyclase (GGDEF)-like protein
VALAIAEPPPPDQSDEMDAADPATRLEHCISLQARAISLVEGERRTFHEGGRPAHLEHTGAELLALLKEAIWHERNIIQEYRALRAEVGSLQTERDELAVALRHTEALSLTDELTGLPNRRAFVQRLDQELSRSQRTGQPLAMVLLDIDNFKSINDRHGHYVGDMILRCYAQSMVREFRQHDLLARYGGEEFVLLLPETLIDNARNAMEKLGRRIRCEPLDAGGIRIDLPTFSAGIACLRSGESATTLIDRADQSLYLAKRLGRNRIETEEQLPPSPTP